MPEPQRKLTPEVAMTALTCFTLAWMIFTVRAIRMVLAEHEASVFGWTEG